MASSLEPDLTCSICKDLFKDPVLLNCSHSFCKDCLQTWWAQRLIKTCPFCKKGCKRRYTNGPPLNLALKNLVEEYKQQRASEPECSLHPEKLRLFCLDHQELICLVCRDSTAHTGHRFSPIEEVAPDLREQLRSSMEPLQDKLKELNERRVQFDDAAAHISAQAERTKEQIRAEFQEKHLCLWLEERSRMKALKEEKEQKTQNMKDKMAAVTRDIEAVSRTISETEEQLRAADASFLLQYKSAVGRVQHCPLVEVPKMDRRDLIDQVKHLGNLGFNLWSHMRSKVQFYPVFLDPNTAGSGLVVSEDLTSVRYGETQKVPAYPERCGNKLVMGRFIPGSHSFDVDVSGNKSWTVGVAGKVQREGDTRRGLLGLRYSNNEYTASPPFGLRTRLSVKNVQRVRVKLDRERKTVTFTDLDTNMDLYISRDTFTFTGKLVPYFSLDTSLKILPKDIISPTLDPVSVPARCQELQAVPLSPALESYRVRLVRRQELRAVECRSILEALWVNFVRFQELQVAKFWSVVKSDSHSGLVSPLVGP